MYQRIDLYIGTALRQLQALVAVCASVFANVRHEVVLRRQALSALGWASTADAADDQILRSALDALRPAIVQEDVASIPTAHPLIAGGRDVNGCVSQWGLEESRTSRAIAAHRPARLRPNSGRIGAISCHFWPNLIPSVPISAELAADLTELGRFQQDVAEIHQLGSEFDQAWSNFDPMFSRLRPKA